MAVGTLAGTAGGRLKRHGDRWVATSDRRRSTNLPVSRRELEAQDLETYSTSWPGRSASWPGSDRLGPARPSLSAPAATDGWVRPSHDVVGNADPFDNAAIGW